MIWEQIAALVVILFALAGGIATAFARADILLSLAVAALAFGGFNVYLAGTVWLPIKIIALWSIVYLCRGRRPNPRVVVSGVIPLTGILCAFVLVAALLGYLIDAPLVSEFTSGVQGSELRPLVQFVGYLSLISLIPLASIALRNEQDLRKFWGVYAACAVVLCLGAAVQLVLSRLGLPFMPILRMHGTHTTLAAFQVESEVVVRVYSFSGEPKALAAFLLPMFFASAVTFFEGPRARPWWARPMIVMVLGGTIVLTFSSAALIGMAVGGVLLTPLIISSLRRSWRLLALVVLVSGMMLTYQAFRGGETAGVEIADLVEDRTVGRLGREVEDRNETAALHYLIAERPELALLGLGLGMYNFHFPWLHGRGFVEPIDSGWITALVDLGALGTLALLGLCAAAIVAGRTALGRWPTDQRWLAFAALAALISSASMHLGWNVFAYLCLFIGAIEATTRMSAAPVGSGQAEAIVRASTGALFGSSARSLRQNWPHRTTDSSSR